MSIESIFVLIFVCSNDRNNKACNKVTMQYTAITITKVTVNHN